MIAITGRADLGDDDFAAFDGYLHKPLPSIYWRGFCKSGKQQQVCLLQRPGQQRV